MSLRALFAWSVAFVLIAAATAETWAQTKYPSRPIRVVVPYTPGGITDVMTRMVMTEVGKDFNQTLIIDNRPGANSIVGVEIVSKSNPDGYTLASVIPAHAANQTLYPKLPYDSLKSFEPISLLGTAPLIACVTNGLPVKSVKELVEHAKSKPGQLSFASSGVGAAAHLTTELLMLTTGIKMVHVPYKGTAPALLDLSGGQVQFMMDTPLSLLPHAKAGKIRALALAADKRAAVAPDVPTFIESGVQVVGGTWVGVLAPAKTPRDVVTTLNRSIVNVVKRQDIHDRIVQVGIDPVGNTPEQFTQFLRDEIAKWGKVIKAANVRVEG
jgi:tripartite-type tricarboxylate transporter receptor subunit TctC